MGSSMIGKHVQQGNEKNNLTGIYCRSSAKEKVCTANALTSDTANAQGALETMARIEPKGIQA